MIKPSPLTCLDNVEDAADFGYASDPKKCFFFEVSEGSKTLVGIQGSGALVIAGKILYSFL